MVTREFTTPYIADHSTKDKRDFADTSPYKMYGDRMFQNSILDLYGASSHPESDLLTKSHRAIGSGTQPRGQTEFRQSTSSAYPLGRWLLGVHRGEKRCV